MMAVQLPSFPDTQSALNWLHGRYRVIRVCLLRGMDGMVRGSAIVAGRVSP